LFSLLVACAPTLPTPDAEARAWPIPDRATGFEAGPALDGAPLPAGLVRGGLTYEIYVRSFQDSDGDGIGDLLGVASRLDHLSSLGVETIWLMPLFPSVGPAGYDTLDYDTVRADYGTEADLDTLVDAAHARGMRVLVDLPLNHVARTHPWFAAAEADPAAPERELFVFADAQWDTFRWFPAAGGGYFYAFFGDTLPDLNWKHDVTRERMLPVFDAWLDRADGYRLDAVIPLIETLDQGIAGTDETHALLAELRARAEAINPDVYLLAEASDLTVEGNTAYLGNDGAPEAHAVIDFPRRAALLDAVASGDPSPLLDVLGDQREAGALGRMAPYLQSHDLPRLASTEADVRVRRLLQVIELTLPGEPILYYGEELDLPDTPTATGQDYAQRGPMPWDQNPNGGFSTGSPWMPLDPRHLDGANVADQDADPASMLNLVRGLACVREATRGAAWELVATDHPSVLAYQRSTEEGRVVVVANLSATEVHVEVDVDGGFRHLGGRGGWYAHEEPGLTLAPYGYGVYAEEIGVGCVVSGGAG
jgi:maltose alpha-D-glucosyltransferase/alpha-amylase